MKTLPSEQAIDRSQYPEILLQRVNYFIAEKGLTATTSSKMTFKLVLGLVWFIGTYLLLFVRPWSPIEFVLLYILHGSAHMFMTFNIAHEANHNTLTNSPSLNRLFSYCFDLCGVSSYMWRILHHRGHHFCMNVHGEDEAIMYPFFRLSPHAPRKWIHKYQHLYGLFLYGFMTLDYVLAKDFKYFFFSNYPIAKKVKHPRREYVILFFGKAMYLTYMLVLPIVVLQLPPLLVITAFVIMHYVLGTAMSWVFAISHVLNINQFPKSNRDFSHFSFQIIATTADYSVENPIANFLLGGFNHHTIHHFVPHVSHVHLPSLTRILKNTSEEYGVDYKANKTMYQGWVQHFRHLKQLGNSD